MVDRETELKNKQEEFTTENGKVQIIQQQLITLASAHTAIQTLLVEANQQNEIKQKYLKYKEKYLKLKALLNAN